MVPMTAHPLDRGERQGPRPGPGASSLDASPAPPPAPAAGGGLAGHGLGKSFSGATVLDDVSVCFAPGEVHTLLGENGAGKSTLFKVLSGLYPADAGWIELGGARLSDLTPRSALEHGIYLVPQEPTLMAHLSAAENLYTGVLPRRRVRSLVDWGRIRRDAARSLERVGLDVEPETPARDLSIAQQQLLECARALVHECRVILFDEPTSPLTAHETDILFGLMRNLAAGGLSLGFISHRLDEVLEISDRVTVLRDGRLVGAFEREALRRDDLVLAMVGREVGVRSRLQRSSGTVGGEVLRVDGLAHPPLFSDISFGLRAHEVVGMAGLVGSGRTEIAETLFGLRPATAGTVRLAGRLLAHRSPRACIDAGLVYLPEDRGRHGIFADVDLSRNVTAGVLPRLPARLGLLRRREEDRRAADAVARTSVKSASLLAAISTLSGGNQQRAMFARWLLAEPKVAILDEPTRGVDIGAKSDIYDIIADLSASGMACLIISSELEELALVCDRVLVVYEGHIVGEVEGGDITPARLGELVVGAGAP